MYIVTNITKINKGEGYKLVNRFDKVGKIESMDGFLGLEVLMTEKIDDHDEVSIVTRWDSEAAFYNLTKTDAFKESLRHKDGKFENIFSNKISYNYLNINRLSIIYVLF